MIDIVISGDAGDNLDMFVQRLPKVLERALGDASRRVAGTAIGSYMRDAKGEPKRRRRDDNGPLRIVSGRLARSFTGASEGGEASEAIYEIHTLPEGGVRLTFGSRVTYAAIHEYGGFAGRAKAAYIPGRPYLNPALRDEEQQVPQIVGTAVGELIQQIGAL
jgi:phage gpG-like protein